MVKLPVLRFQLDPFLIASHCAFVPLKSILVKPLQPWNAYEPMLVTPSGIMILVKPVQL